MTSEDGRSGYHSEFSSWFGMLASRISLHVRRKMFDEFALRFADPTSALDVGVTSENVAPEANFFEEMFAHKDRITAVGVEDAAHLERRYPGLRFVRVTPGAPLPFRESEFEVAFSNAVIEHVVDDEGRARFLGELLRVSKSVFVTTPNRFFPIESHTGVPLLHALAPRLFYRLLDKGRFSNFYGSANLRLLTKRDLVACAERTGLPYEIVPVRFCGFISNWIAVISKATGPRGTA